MKRIWGFIKRILSSRILLYIVGMLIAAALIWFIGPLIGIGDSQPLGTALQRMLAITLIPAIMGIGATFANGRMARQNQDLQHQLTETPKVKAAVAGAEETSELGGRLKEALDLLKKTKVRRSWGSGWLYQLPWYMFIGPPGSGKTTALVNSGLSFPLAGQLGKKAVKGVGGTRTCDWWFTDDAVLIDTAGRYTTQDSDSAVDAAAWGGFMKLLKKYRKRQPINGAIVAIGISDLLAASEDQRQEHAEAIKKRLIELYAELGVRFPVYVLFTKVDLIAGFVEFFDDLGREGREQVWGMTFDAAKSRDEAGAVDAYAEEFDALIGRLNQRLPERLQQEGDIQRRAQIFGFPQQIASLKQLTDGFLHAIFEANRYQKPALLRGVYFTSGTQTGTPIDRLMGSVAASFGISRQQLAVLSDSGRSYFLTRLMKNVIFGEASLVSADAKVERRARLVGYGAIGIAATIVLLIATAWTVAYFDNNALIEGLETQAAAFDDSAKAMPLERVADADLRRVLPLLNRLRDLPGGYAHRHDTPLFLLQLGLYQGDKLGSQAIAVYRRELNRVLLPRMLLRLEQQLSANQGKLDLLYDGLKVYMTLGQLSPRFGSNEKSLIKHWMTLDWQAQFPGPENGGALSDLRGHLDALLERPLMTYDLDGGLIARVQKQLAQMTVADRVYRLIRGDAKITALPDWTIADHAGPTVGRVFVRGGNHALTDGIPGLFTYDGYFRHFKPLLPEATKEVSSDSWVLGQKQTASGDPAALGQLQRDVTTLYLKDFEDYWDRLIAEVAIKPFASIGDAAQTLNVLAGADSPLRGFIVSAANETWLSHAPAAAAPGNVGDLADVANQAANQAAHAAEQKATSRVPNSQQSLVQQQLGGVLGPQNAANDIAGPETDRHFKTLHDLVGDGKATSPLETAITDLNDLYLQTNKVASSGETNKPIDTAKVQADAARTPEPVHAMMQSVTTQVATLSAGGARTNLNGLWTAQVLPTCESILQNSYPMAKGAPHEIPLADFARLFAKNGLIDAFVTANVLPYVDTSKNPWVSKKVNNVEVGIAPAALAMFQRAAWIRDNMFGADGAKPSVGFELVPVSLDTKSTQVTVDVDGQTLTYDNGPVRGTKMVWPGPGLGHVRIAFQPQTPGETAAIDKDGAWAWFRILQESQMRRGTGADRFVVTFTVGSRSASFEIHADSVINPFVPGQLEAFRCPGKL